MSKETKQLREPTLQERLEARLDELRAEYARGEEQVAHHQDALAQLSGKMPRISGAIQVVEESLGLREVE